MTFYWWSHWFWITLLSNILILIAVVQTYPSQEISLEYNQNSKPQKTITKLYQTTTMLTWATATTPHVKAMDTAGEKTILQSVTPEVLRSLTADDEPGSSTVDGVDDGSAEAFQAVDASASDEELEFKRSADNYNQSAAGVRQIEIRASSGQSGEQQASVVAMQPQANADGDNSGASDAATVESSVKLKRDDGQMNNYTNFSRTPHVADNSTSDALPPSAGDSATLTQPPPKSTSTAPAAPKIDSTHATLEWLNAMAAAAVAAPPTITPAASHTAEVVTAAAQRIPFTLENANKEEELRRAESEHRSRKSKVLSAEYKHINRFINYSADTKSLLTRSASTAPNDFDGADESNISSEALSVQRTYFLDAGAISAICFTIFGVCCTVGTIGIVLYRRRYLNKPQALSEPDSSVYIDDSTMRDNSDEMYSLDNDSFLNSLEAMTIQNYWTDTVKHTKL